MYVALALPGRNPELPRKLAPVPLGERVGQPVHPHHDRHRRLVEPAPGGGEGDARPAAFKKGDEELFLERPNLLGNGRLAREEVLGRPSDAPQAGRMAERPELFQAISLGATRLLCSHFGIGTRRYRSWKY